MIFSDPSHLRRLIIAALVSGLAAGIISALHHWYGALAYDTPWRGQVSYWILAITVLVYSLLFVYWKYADNLAGKMALWLFLFGAVFFQTGFTLFECVYSHVIKNILFFAGLSRENMLQLYPPPAYHLPDNVFFEFTGVLQLVGLLAAWYAYRIFKERPWALKNGDDR